MAHKKPPRRSPKLLRGIRFDAPTLARVSDYIARTSLLAGFEVPFSEAVRALVVAGLERDEANAKDEAQ